MNSVEKLSWKMFVAVAAVAALSLSVPPGVQASKEPMEVIRSGTQRAMDLLGDCEPGEELHLGKHRGEIVRIVEDYFDFREMAMRSLGRNWKGLPSDKREEFVRIFKDLIFNTYIDRVDTYTCGGGEEVSYESEEIRGRYASVRTRVSDYKDTEVSVEYRMKKKDGQWMVYDVIVEGVSLVNNYRSQFGSILNRNSVDELLARMKEKVAEQQ